MVYVPLWTNVFNIARITMVVNWELTDPDVKNLKDNPR